MEDLVCRSVVGDWVRGLPAFVVDPVCGEARGDLCYGSQSLAFVAAVTEYRHKSHRF
jgi:hypothetical protein